jgi:hypothetical protein
MSTHHNRFCAGERSFEPCDNIARVDDDAAAHFFACGINFNY